MTTPIKYQGDPKLYVDEDGSTFRIKNGNTIMERGAANHILIALLTDEEPKHINALFDNDYEKIKPHYQRFTGKPITSTNLQDRVSAAKADLKPLIDLRFAEEISARIENPRGIETRLTITIDGKDFVLTSDNNSLGFLEEE
jgi:hypothetical protein